MLFNSHLLRLSFKVSEQDLRAFLFTLGSLGIPRKLVFPELETKTKQNAVGWVIQSEKVPSSAQNDRVSERGW